MANFTPKFTKDSQRTQKWIEKQPTSCSLFFVLVFICELYGLSFYEKAMLQKVKKLKSALFSLQ